MEATALLRTERHRAGLTQRELRGAYRRAAEHHRAHRDGKDGPARFDTSMRS